MFHLSSMRKQGSRQEVNVAGGGENGDGGPKTSWVHSDPGLPGSLQAQIRRNCLEQVSLVLNQITHDLPKRMRRRTSKKI